MMQVLPPLPPQQNTQKIQELSDSAAVDADCAQNALPSSRGDLD